MIYYYFIKDSLYFNALEILLANSLIGRRCCQLQLAKNSSLTHYNCLEVLFLLRDLGLLLTILCNIQV
ncbi:hypothetical protein CVS40_7916 [Lucilia cuprina]|nr:hypothetical protein CVS40_7916 [Lucilia cuprina]